MMQLLPFIRGTPTDPALTLERMARCVFALPASWCAQSQDTRAGPVLEQVQAISRVLQSGRVSQSSRIALEHRLSEVLIHLQGV